MNICVPFGHPPLLPLGWESPLWAQEQITTAEQPQRWPGLWVPQPRHNPGGPKSTEAPVRSARPGAVHETPGLGLGMEGGDRETQLLGWNLLLPGHVTGARS